MLTPAGPYCRARKMPNIVTDIQALPKYKHKDNLQKAIQGKAVIQAAELGV